MGEYRITGPLSGKGYVMPIAGDEPTADERLWADSYIRQREPDVLKELETQTGMTFSPEDYGGGFGNQVGEFFKGLGSGALSLAESADLGILSVLPERYENPARDFVRNKYLDAQSPFAPDIGLEDSMSRKVGSAFGSTLPFFATAPLGAAGVGLAGVLGVASGVGEASERARAAGATQEERNLAALKGVFPGVMEAFPVGSLLGINRFLGPQKFQGLIGFLSRVAAEGGVEAAQEAASEAIQNAIQQGYDPEQEIITGLGEPAALGGTVGATVQALVELALRNRGTRPGAPERNTSDEAPPTPPTPLTEDTPMLPLEGGTGTGLTTDPTQESILRRQSAVQGELPFPPTERQLDLGMEETIRQGELGRPFNPTATTPAEQADARAPADAAVAEELAAVSDRTPYNISTGEERIDPNNPDDAPALENTPTPPTPEVGQVGQVGQGGQASTVITQKTAKDNTPKDVIAPAPSEVEPAGSAGQGVANTDVSEINEARAEETLDAAKKAAENTGQILANTEEGVDAVQEALTAKPPEPDTQITLDLLKQLGVPKGTAVYNAVRSGKGDQRKFRKQLQSFARGKNPAAPAAREWLQSGVRPDERPGDSAAMGSREGVRDDSDVLGQRGSLERDAVPGRSTTAQAAAVDYARGNVGAAPSGARPEPDQLRPNPAETAARQAISRRQKQVRNAEQAARFGVDPRLESIPDESDADATEAALDKWLVDTVEPDLLDYQARLSEGRPAPRNVAGELWAPSDADIPVADKKEILNLLRKSKKRGKWDFTKAKPKEMSLEEFAAVRYFARGPNTIIPLEDIAHDRWEGGSTSPEDDYKSYARTNRAQRKASGPQAGMTPADVDKAKRAAEKAKKNFLGRKWVADKTADADPTPEDAHKHNTKTGRMYAAAAQRWMEKNLSERTMRIYRRFLADEFKMFKAGYDRWANAMDTEAAVTLQNEQYSDGTADAAMRQAAKNHNLMTRSVITPLSPKVKALLRAGDLRTALIEFGVTTPDPKVGRLALVLSELVGDTRVRVYEKGGVINKELSRLTGSKDVLGRFQMNYGEPLTPENKFWEDLHNTVLLREDALDAHTLLHEVVHMATERVLQQDNHPTTRALQALFDEIKPLIEGAYAAQSLDEFVAEAMTNPQFQADLARFSSKGTKLTGWQRFQSAIHNLLRRMMGMPPAKGNALTATQDMVETILSVAPKYRKVGNYINMANEPGGAANLLGKAYKGVRPMNRNDAKALFEAVHNNGVGNGTKSFLMGLVPLVNLSDFASPFFPSAKRFDILVGNQRSFVTTLNDTAESTFKEIGHKLDANRDRIDDYNNLTILGTIHEVAAWKPRNTYKDDKGKLEIWDKLQPMFRRLKKVGLNDEIIRMQGLMNHIRKAYRDTFDERLKTMVRDTKQRQKLAKMLAEKFAPEQLIDPYHPLQRRGEYWLAYYAIDPFTGNREYFKESFAKRSDRAKTLAEMQDMADAIQFELEGEYTNTDNSFMPNEGPPTQFVDEVRDLIKQSGVDKNASTELQNQVSELAFNMMPERSFMNAFRSRHGADGKAVRGAIGDVLPGGKFAAAARPDYDVILHTKQRVSSMVRQLGRVKYGPQFKEMLADIETEYKEGMKKDPTRYNKEWPEKLYKELQLRGNTAYRLDRSGWSRGLTGFAFGMTLGLNVSSALVNLVALPTVVFSYIAPKYGYRATTRAMRTALAVYAASGRTREVSYIDRTGKVATKRSTMTMADQSIQNYDFSDPRNAAVKDLETLVEVGKDRGLFVQSIAYDSLDMDEVGSSANTTSWGDKARIASGFIFHHTERVARETTAIAAYRMEQEKIAKGKYGGDVTKLTKEEQVEAANEAFYLMEITNGSAAAAASPRLAQGDLGSVLLLYKRYALGVFMMQAQMIRNVKDPETRRMGMAQLGTLYGTMGLFSGAAGLPLFGEIASIFNLFKDDEDESIETLTRTTIGELPYKGMLNYLTNTEVSSRIGLSNMFFREPLGAANNSVFWNALVGVGGPVPGVFLQMERAFSLRNEDPLRAVETAMPAAFRNFSRGFRYGVLGDVPETLREDAIIDNVSIGNAVGQFFGFAPADYIQQLEKNTEYKRIDTAINRRRTKLMREYYLNLRARDYVHARQVLEEIREFNKDNPQNPIGPESLRRSSKSHEDTDSRMVGGVTYSKSNAQMIENYRRDWGRPSLEWGRI